MIQRAPTHSSLRVGTTGATGAGAPWNFCG